MHRLHTTARRLPIALLLLAVLVAATPLALAAAQDTEPPPADDSAPASAPTSAPSETSMNADVTSTPAGSATGTFEVELKPQPLADENADPSLGRLSIDKTFHGDLEATSRGEMLSARTAVDGSAGYVAIERVTGTLAGRSGSFVLQHTGTMDRGRPSLSVTVVPDSGTDGLEGLTGSMDIDVSGGGHAYTFRFELPPEG